MPKGIMNNLLIKKQKTVFHRSNKEAYGASSIWLQPLEVENSVVNIDGREVWLPVLNVQKYYSNARCYAFIEKIENYPIIMIDVLYSDEDILSKLENDEDFLNSFLNMFSRTKINFKNHSSPFLAFVLNNSDKGSKFLEAVQKAMTDDINQEIVDLESIETTKIELEEPLNTNKASEDKKENIFVDFIKSFYEAISRKPVKRNNGKVKSYKKVDAKLEKKARLMKSGAIILPEKIIEKYCVNYYMGMEIEEGYQDVGDTLGIHFEDVDDQMLVMHGPKFDERREKFKDILFDSTILETFLRLYAKKPPILIFAGRYNESEGKMEVDREVDRYFNRINELLEHSRPSGEGR